MAVPISKPALFFFFLSLLIKPSSVARAQSWCVARSDASYQALQTALDYACGSGADCGPIQSDGLCFLPNTIQAHASYAFSSYYQRRAMAPGSCDFSGTGTVAKTDPSYGSCMYPSSQRSAGGIATLGSGSRNNPNVPTTTTTSAPITSGDGGTEINNAGLTPPFPTTDESKASLDGIVTKNSMFIMILLVLSFILHPVWNF
ncbi:PLASMODESMATA CALLOSE-BINDING PROTEIN 1-like [Hibiscus syriacus]|uniref:PLASMODESMATA CALLOSE-BINDING PROTEIN 1-like n=1 Tax=Hibiscus syriacus TaxID=106335 RepID=UPI0019243A56|nr:PLASMODESMATA CALLOSE-BINDING PROTEIN 1-like [Hibiscus syriacus]